MYDTKKSRKLDKLEYDTKKLFMEAFEKGTKNELYCNFMNKLNNNQISIGNKIYNYDTIIDNTKNLFISELNDFARITSYLIDSRYERANQYIIMNWFDCVDITIGDRIKNYVLNKVRRLYDTKYKGDK